MSDLRVVVEQQAAHIRLLNAQLAAVLRNPPVTVHQGMSQAELVQRQAQRILDSLPQDEGASGRLEVLADAHRRTPRVPAG